MPASSSTPQRGNARRRSAVLNNLLKSYRDLPSDHPLLIAARTYALSVSFSLAPALLPILTSRTDSKKLGRLYRLFKNEFGPRGFASAMTIAIGGGAVFDRLWHWIDSDESSTFFNRLSSPHFKRVRDWSRRMGTQFALKTFLTSLGPSLAAILLMHSRRRSLNMERANIPFTIPISQSQKTPAGRVSITLDLTLLLLVRALDAALQGELVRRAETHTSSTAVRASKTPTIHDIRARASKMADKLDASLFWISASRSA